MSHLFSRRILPLVAFIPVIVVVHLVLARFDQGAGGGRVFVPLVEGNPPSVTLEKITDGLDLVTAIASAGDDRLFIAERTGRIRILLPDGSVLPSPFLDIHSRVESRDREQGLLNIVFHPDYGRNGFFFVYYTARSDVLDSAPVRVSMVRVDPANPNRALPDSESVVLEIPGTKRIHNGGGLAFDPAGYLVIGVGDGANGGQAQQGDSLFGKLLRIDVNVPIGEAYRIPPSNPYRGADGIRDEIWALGFRNPWRLTFDPVTGSALIGDVGNHAWEEVDAIPADWDGGNFGWPCFEGTASGPGAAICAALTDAIFPVIAYSHATGDCAIVGGYVYRGPANPALGGIYLHTDFCSGLVKGARPASDGAWSSWQAADQPGLIWTTFGQDSTGELYLAGLAESGVIYRIVNH